MAKRQNLLQILPEYDKLTGRRLGYYCYILSPWPFAKNAYTSRRGAPPVVVEGARNEKEAYEKAVEVYAREHGINVDGPWGEHLRGVV